MKKIAVIVSILFNVLLISLSFIFFFDYKLEIKDVKLVNVDYDEDIFEISISKKNNILFDHDFSCKAIYGDDIITGKSKNGTCNLKIPVNSNYSIQLINKFSETKNYELEKYIDNEFVFSFDDSTVYLAVGEEYKINYDDIMLIKKERKYEFKLDKENIVTINDNTIKGITPGEVTISLEGANNTMKVIVTDLITAPTVRDRNVRKPVVPCNKYNEEENALMDSILKSDVDKAGRGTRAGAVAAARFLTLKFPYRIPYFYENGRLDKGGVHIADGEGRYYHEGLYLSKNKMENITPNYSGPAIWGCPLRNWEDDPYFGYIPGALVPNGLDCSGFVAWTLVNGGFDPGDIGAGETEDAYQMTDLGKFVKLDMSVIKSGVIKVGDLFNYWGHISIIIGFDGTYYYVAESLPNFGGVDVRIYNAEEAVDMFRYVVLMDDFYKEDGNYTEFWD